MAFVTCRSATVVRGIVTELKQNILFVEENFPSSKRCHVLFQRLSSLLQPAAFGSVERTQSQ